MSNSQYSDLSAVLNKTKCHCLNEKKGHELRNIFLDKDLYLESDIDEQLLITIEFMQPIKLFSLEIKPTSSLDHAPKKIKTFVNTTVAGFDAAESLPIVEELELTKEMYESKEPVRLRFVRYQNVQSLALFVESNLGDEETTRIKSIKFNGQTINATKDLSELKKQDHAE